MGDTNATGATPGSGSDLLSPIGIALGAVQTGIGIVNGITDRRRIQSLLTQRKAYQTPQQIYDIVNATENQSQGDTITRNYETNQIDQGLSDSLGAATRLGANPNDLSGLFQQSVNGIMKVGQQFHQSNTEAFSNLINSYKLLADNKDAEYASGQDILKDKLAASGAQLTTANNNVSGGINTILGSSSAKGIGDLFKHKGNKGGNGDNTSTDLSQMLNDYLFANQTNNSLSGNVTTQDMIGSEVNNNNANYTG